MLFSKKYNTVLLFFFLILIGSPAVLSQKLLVPADTIKKNVIEKQLLQLPFLFIKNEGQWDNEILYSAITPGSGINVNFMQQGLSLGISRMVPEKTGNRISFMDKASTQNEKLVWNIYFEGKNPDAFMTSDSGQKGKMSYFFGNDSNRWVKNAPEYNVIQYNSIYNKTDVRYYGKKTNLKYDYILHPGADISNIRMRYGGIDKLILKEAGELEVKHAWGILLEEKPYSYQLINGKKKEIDIRYILYDDKTFGFKIYGQHDKNKELVIDPGTMIWATYMNATANSLNNMIQDITADSLGFVYVTGQCDNSYPVTPGAYSTGYGGGTCDIFVSKLTPQGNALVWSTYLGGSGYDEGYAIVTNDLNEVYITGRAMTGYPTTVGVIKTVYTGVNYDIAVTHLNSAGNGLIYSTLVGGTLTDEGYDLYIDNAGNATITGIIHSTDFPVTGNAAQPAFGGGILGNYDAYLLKINANATTILYASYIGGAGDDQAYGLAVDNAGNSYITGFTNSDNFQVLNAYQSIRAGNFDAFLTKIRANGTIEYSTYLGGVSNDGGAEVVLNSANEPYVAGGSGSSDFPVTGSAFQTLYGGGTSDAFITKFNANANALIYSRYMGGSGYDDVTDLEINSNGEVYVTGITNSVNLPVTTGAFQSSLNVAVSSYVNWYAAQLNASGTGLLCSSYIRPGDTQSFYMFDQPHSYLDDRGISDTLYYCATTNLSGFPATPGVYEENKINGTGAQPVIFKMVPCNFSFVINPIKTNASCKGDSTGSIAVNPSGGTPGYSYSWSPYGGTNSLATALIAGIYTVTVTDSAGEIATAIITITESPAYTIQTTSTPSSCDSGNGSATAIPVGGVSPYTYVWSNAQITLEATGLTEGTYTVVITDANNCTNTTSAIVAEMPCACPSNLKLILPNAFSPNNDGENDEFCLMGSLPAAQAGIDYCIKELLVSIYDRWGEKIFESSDKFFCWDGKHKGYGMNTAMFLYYLEAIFSNGEKITQKGNVSLIK